MSSQLTFRAIRWTRFQIVNVWNKIAEIYVCWSIFEVLSHLTSKFPPNLFSWDLAGRFKMAAPMRACECLCKCTGGPYARIRYLLQFKRRSHSNPWKSGDYGATVETEIGNRWVKSAEDTVFKNKCFLISCYRVQIRVYVNSCPQNK